MFEAQEALSKRERLIGELRDQLQAAREREQLLQRQVQEEAATAQSFRVRAVSGPGAGVRRHPVA